MEKMVKCKSCGADIAKSAKTCPSCGAKQKKPIGLIIAAAVVLLIIIGAVGGSSSSGPNKVGEVGDNPSAKNTPPAPSQSETPSIFHKGDVVELNGVNVTLLDVIESSGSQFNKPTDGNVFVIFEFEIDNQSEKEIAVSSLMMFDPYFDDYATNLSLMATVETGKTQLDGSVAAGKKMSGVVGYEAPADWETAEIHVTPDFWGGEDIIFEYSK